MTTKLNNTGGDRSQTAYLRAAPPTYRAFGDSAGSNRLKRLILIGAVASFLSFFGLTVAFDYQGQHAAPVQQQASSVNLQSLFSNDDDGGSATAPQIRTRTS